MVGSPLGLGRCWNEDDLLALVSLVALGHHPRFGSEREWLRAGDMGNSRRRRRRRRAAMYQRHLNTFYGHGALLALRPSWYFCPILSQKNNLVGSHLHHWAGPCHPALYSPSTATPQHHPNKPKHTDCVCFPSLLHHHDHRHPSPAYIKQQIKKINIPNSPHSPFKVLGRDAPELARKQV